jgi:hypothetical protein
MRQIPAPPATVRVTVRIAGTIIGEIYSDMNQDDWEALSTGAPWSPGALICHRASYTEVTYERLSAVPSSP